MLQHFVNVYLDIDSKVSRELKTYGANMIFAPKDMATSDDMSEKTYNEMIAKSAKRQASWRERLSLCSGKYRPKQTPIVMGTKFSNLKKVKPFLDVRDGTMINVDFDDKKRANRRRSCSSSWL